MFYDYKITELLIKTQLFGSPLKIKKLQITSQLFGSPLIFKITKLQNYRLQHNCSDHLCFKITKLQRLQNYRITDYNTIVWIISKDYKITDYNAIVWIV